MQHREIGQPATIYLHYNIERTRSGNHTPYRLFRLQEDPSLEGLNKMAEASPRDDAELHASGDNITVKQEVGAIGAETMFSFVDLPTELRLQVPTSFASKSSISN